MGALDKFEGFASEYGPAFYGLPLNEDKITLVRGETGPVPAFVATQSGPVVPFHAGEQLNWEFAQA